MLIHKGNRIGDAWYFVRDNLVHAYYLTCPVEIPPHVQWDIGHATSRDLVEWEVHELALCRGKRGAWDDALATGSILYWQNRYWMAYTGHRTQQIGVAVSDDLFHWERISEKSVTGIDTRYYEPVGSGERKQPHWRDPFLFEHEG
jgi:beta-fructofuranosidase